MSYTLTLDEDFAIRSYESDFFVYENPKEVKPLILTPVASCLNDEPSDWKYFLDAVRNSGDEEEDDEKEFIAHYREIVRGKRPEWMLTRVRVFPEQVNFWYDKPSTRGVGLLSSRRRAELHFLLEGPRTVTGLVPKYRIDMSNGYTTVIEIIGHSKREFRCVYEDRELKLKVTEFIGI